jgi:hypothetical protein
VPIRTQERHREMNFSAMTTFMSRSPSPR